MKLGCSWIGWIVMATACAGDDAGGDDSVGGTSVGGTTVAHGSTDGSAGDDAATTTQATGSGVDGSAGSDGAQTSASDGGGMQTCGDLVCDADQICVQPCCGGPAPACEPLGPGGTCASGAQPVPAAQCPGGCDGETCCPPIPCVPDPPHCLTMTDVTCDGTFCSAPGCQGMLEPDGSLACQCA